MLELGHVGVRITVVDQLVEILGRLPDAHFHAVEAQIFRLLGPDEVAGLELVVQPVEFPDGGPGVRLIVAEFRLLLLRVVAHGGLLGGRLRHGLRVPLLIEILDLIEALKGLFLCGQCGLHRRRR
jgi:hypothetical protein